MHVAKKVVGIVDLLLAVILVFVGASPCFAQITLGTGSIGGMVSDPSGAVVVGARINITNVATERVIEVTTNSGGLFQSGALIPGNYKVVVFAEGFASVEADLRVLIGNVSTLNAKLQPDQGKEVIEVYGSEIKVNTQQPTVQGVLNAEQ